MPYSVPSAPLPAQLGGSKSSGSLSSSGNSGRPGHRRSYSGTSGTFTPLPSLPRRQPAFHFRNDDSSSTPDNSDDDDDDDDDRQQHQLPHQHHQPHTNLQLNIPFPRSSPSRPTVSRTTSSPILLSNGKPLKSSLKSSSSAPNIPATPKLRARSAPSSPSMSQPKNVHFPSKEQGGLETVRFYSRSARPTSISLTLPLDDTETETDSERPQVFLGHPPSSLSSSSFPFPRISKSASTNIVATTAKRTQTIFQLDTSTSSPVPAPNPPPYANVHLESLFLLHDNTSNNDQSTPPTLHLKGSLLVRNLAYAKTVALRFTLDEWVTTSEVTSHYTASLPALPPALFVPGSGFSSSAPAAPTAIIDNKDIPVEGSPAWDRFMFTIRLDDYALSLATRTLWLVARYNIPPSSSLNSNSAILPPGLSGSSAEEASPPSIPAGGSGSDGGEWWDNNSGGNYRITFCTREAPVRAGRSSSSSSSEEDVKMAGIFGKRKMAVSTPSFPTPPPPPPPKSQPVMITLTAPSPTHTQQAYTRAQISDSVRPPSPPSTLASARAQTTLTRLRSLSLKNYAAPVPAAVPSSPPLSQPPPSSRSPPRSPSLLSISSSEGSPILSTPVDIPGTSGQNQKMEMEGGFPATLGGMGMGVEMEPLAGGGGGGVGSYGAAFTASTSPPGISSGGIGAWHGFGKKPADAKEKETSTGASASASASGVALYWPWGTGTGTGTGSASGAGSKSGMGSVIPGGDGIDGVAAMTLPLLPPPRSMEKEAPVTTTPSPLPLPSPIPGSASGSTSPRQAPQVRLGRRVFPPLDLALDSPRVLTPPAVKGSVVESGFPFPATTSSGVSSPTTYSLSPSPSSTPTLTSSTSFPGAPFPSPAMPLVERYVDEWDKEKEDKRMVTTMDPDAVYQAILKKWCFAGPSPSPAAAVGAGLTSTTAKTAIGPYHHRPRSVGVKAAGTSAAASGGEGVSGGRGRGREGSGGGGDGGGGGGSGLVVR